MSTGDDTEEWRQVPSAPRYEVSSHGRIRTVPGTARAKRKSVGVPRALRSLYGYPAVFVPVGKHGSRSVGLHLLVAETFLGKKPRGYQVDHINGDKNDARPANLEYVTPAENARRARQRGLRPRTPLRSVATALHRAIVGPVLCPKDCVTNAKRCPSCAALGESARTLASALLFLIGARGPRGRESPRLDKEIALAKQAVRKGDLEIKVAWEKAYRENEIRWQEERRARGVEVAS